MQHTTVRPFFFACTCSITLAAASCGPLDAAPVSARAGSTATQAMSSSGPRNPAGGCNPEYSSCPPITIDGTEVGGGGGGGGGAGEVSCGPNGETWVPGTGCHPDSKCFQDIDNLNNAVRIQWALLECQQKGGKGGIFPNPETGEPAGVVCEVNGVGEATNFPTTKACVDLTTTDTKTSTSEGLESDPTRDPKDAPPTGDDGADEAADDGTGDGSDEVDADEAREERIDDRIGRTDP